MNYTVDIIDTQDNTHITSNEYAKAESIVLDWKGGDSKDDLFVVGSSLSFTLISLQCNDGQYYDLFTGDETRFKVHLYDENGKTIWNGFILPDEYSEPYRDAPIDVKFLATDGLGRLKGKYLPDDFYKEEKSVIEILAKCLELTGLQLDFRFSPAIENYQQKDYNKIYLDGANFQDNDKKQDAHKILKDLLESMCCTLYQADNYYNIEGLNIRNFRTYDAKIYNYNGLLIDEQTITREVKDVTPLATPQITMQPPYGIIEIEHEKEPVEFAEGLYKEENDGWVVMETDTESEDNDIYATEWFSQGDFWLYARGKDPSQIIITHKSSVGGQVRLRKQPYIKQGKKYEVKLGFKLITGAYDEQRFQEFIDEGKWENPFSYSINLTFDKDYYNVSSGFQTIKGNSFAPSTNPSKFQKLGFDLDKKVEFTFQFVSNYSGILDVWLNKLFDNPFYHGILAVIVEKVTLEELGFEETETAVRTMDNFTKDKRETIEYGSDAHGLSKAFRLQKLNEPYRNEIITVTINNNFYYQGYYYAYVNLKGANVIKENSDNVYSSGNKIKVLDVIYNYNNSQNHALKLESPIPNNSLEVYIYDYNGVKENRDYWEQWSDSIFKIEKNKYTEAVADIYNRTFNLSLPKISDLTVRNAVKFNEFINFTYRSKKEFICTNCKWFVDKGYSNVTSTESYYLSNSGNIIPSVEAGNDIYFEGDTLQLNAEAFDPDGYIDKYQWEELTGNGASFGSPNSASSPVYGLNAEYYEFKVTVTDNDGATASDIVKAYKRQNIGVSLSKVFEGTDVSFQHGEFGFTADKAEHYRFVSTPDVAENTSLNLTGKLEVKVEGVYSSSAIVARIMIDESEENYLELRGPGEGDEVKSQEFSINYIKGSVIRFELYVHVEAEPSFNSAVSTANIFLDNVQFVDGFGDITGYPISKTLNIVKLS